MPEQAYNRHMKRTSLFLPNSQISALKALAKGMRSKGMNVYFAGLVREAIAQYLDRRPKP